MVCRKRPLNLERAVWIIRQIAQLLWWRRVPMHCHHCQGEGKGLSGEQECRKVSPRDSEGQFCVQERLGSRRVVFLLDSCMGRGLFSHLYCWFSCLHTQRPLRGNNKSCFQGSQPSRAPCTGLVLCLCTLLWQTRGPKDCSVHFLLVSPSSKGVDQLH